MIGRHLAPREVEAYAERDVEDAVQGAIELHLADCAPCRERVRRAARLETALCELPRETAPRDLAERILTTLDWRAAELQARSKRRPLIAIATLSSLLLAFWFGIQMIIAFQLDDAWDFFSLFTSRPDILSTYSSDALFALLESLPISEILMTGFAILIALVLAQQLMDTVPPRVAHSK